MKHDLAAYKNGCRCDTCREANRINQTAANARRQAALTPDSPVVHGRPATYNNHGCRCQACSQAKADYQRARRTGGAK